MLVAPPLEPLRGGASISSAFLYGTVYLLTFSSACC